MESSFGLFRQYFVQDMSGCTRTLDAVQSESLAGLARIARPFEALNKAQVKVSMLYRHFIPEEAVQTSTPGKRKRGRNYGGQAARRSAQPGRLFILKGTSGEQ